MRTAQLMARFEAQAQQQIEHDSAVTMGTLFDITTARRTFGAAHGGEAADDVRHPADWQHERIGAETELRDALRAVGRRTPGDAFTRSRAALLLIVASAMAQLEALDRAVIRQPQPSLGERLADARERGCAPDMAVIGA